MKKWILSVVGMAFSFALQAQGLGSFFTQKQTQKQYLLQQIAALKLYINYAQKGYDIAKDGLQTIGGFTKGEWEVHGDYVESLDKVNPDIKSHPERSAITSLQHKIAAYCLQLRREVNSNDQFSTAEQQYIGRVLDRVLADAVHDLEELLALTIDNELRLKDDERVERIGKLYAATKEQWVFVQKFGGDTRLLAAARKREQQNIQNSRVLHGIKKSRP